MHPIWVSHFMWDYCFTNSGEHVNFVEFDLSLSWIQKDLEKKNPDEIETKTKKKKNLSSLSASPLILAQ